MVRSSGILPASKAVLSRNPNALIFHKCGLLARPGRRNPRVFASNGKLVIWNILRDTGDFDSSINRAMQRRQCRSGLLNG